MSRSACTWRIIRWHRIPNYPPDGLPLGIATIPFSMSIDLLEMSEVIEVVLLARSSTEISDYMYFPELEHAKKRAKGRRYGSFHSIAPF